MTNLDYETSHKAIEEFKSGQYSSLYDACVANNANQHLANIMLGNETVITEDVFVDDATRLARVTECNSCDQLLPQGGGTCNQCACPIVTIVNMQFKSCPLEKW
jgi:hypothetical protein